MVQTGAKTYQIADQDGNDLGVFRFIPSDAGILKRYKEAATFFTGINDKIKDKDFEEILPDLEKEAGEKIDLLFGAPVSESFFKITSPEHITALETGFSARTSNSLEADITWQMVQLSLIPE